MVEDSYRNKYNRQRDCDLWFQDEVFCEISRVPICLSIIRILKLQLALSKKEFWAFEYTTNP